MEPEVKGGRETMLREDVAFKYLPGHEFPCRLLLPAFSFPGLSWWRTATWLPLWEAVGREKKQKQKDKKNVKVT